jgi:polyhydroxyalkanoate synthesis regulator phasin
MEDALKKFLYAGVELAAATSDRFQKQVTDLVKKGKISETEGKKLVDEFLDKADKGKKDLEKRYEALTERLGVNQTEEAELEKLKKKVSDLESKLGKEKTAKATAKA